MAQAQELHVESVVMVHTEPDYKSEGVRLWPLCRKFYEDPENEKAFQEWKKEREKK